MRRHALTTSRIRAQAAQQSNYSVFGKDCMPMSNVKASDFAGAFRAAIGCDAAGRPVVDFA